MMNKNDLTDKESKTIAWYNDNALAWANKHGSLGDKPLMFEKDMQLLFELSPKGTILEIGTGHGGDAMRLTSHFGVENYKGVDASEGLLKIAKERNPGVDLRVMSVYQLDFPDNSFDAFWVSAMLIHIPKKRLVEALGEINRVTKPEGFGFMSVMEGDGDLENSRPGRYYTLWKEAEFKEELKRSGFEVVSSKKTDTSDSPWMRFIVKKTSN